MWKREESKTGGKNTENPCIWLMNWKKRKIETKKVCERCVMRNKSLEKCRRREAVWKPRKEKKRE